MQVTPGLTIPGHSRDASVRMNRLFGKGKPKEPAPNLGDCVANVDSRAESVDKKIARLDAELRKYKVGGNIFRVNFFSGLEVDSI